MKANNINVRHIDAVSKGGKWFDVVISEACVIALEEGMPVKLRHNEGVFIIDPHCIIRDIKTKNQ